MPAVDIVIPTYGRPASLVRCLEALSQQSFRDFAVTVVDDASADPVAPAVEALRLPYPVRVERQVRNAGPAAARNRGVALAGAPLVLFVDDDVVAAPDLLACHLAAWEAQGPRTVVIGPLAAPGDWRPTPWNRWEAHTLAVEYARMLAGDYEPTWRQCFTGNLLVPREEFLAAGGFDASFTRAEDIELAYRLHRGGCRFVFEPAAIGWHYAERSLASWRAIPRQYARFDQEIARLYPELGWQAALDEQRAHRAWPTRAACAALGPVRGERVAAAAAIGAARVLHRTGVNAVAMPLLSLAFELEYAASLRTAAPDEGSASRDLRTASQP